MSTMSTRERWLLAALPTLLILVLGWGFFLRPAGREVALLRLRVQQQGLLGDRQALVSRAQTERAELEKTVTEKRNAPREEEGSTFDRNFAMQQISVLCSDLGLSLNSTTLEASGKLSPVLQEATAALTRGTNAPLPQVWRIELTGSYPNVQRLLSGLQKTRPLIVPLNLSMETGKTERQPVKWVLTVWL